jgi:hypothetical protein
LWDELARFGLVSGQTIYVLVYRDQSVSQKALAANYTKQYGYDSDNEEDVDETATAPGISVSEKAHGPYEHEDHCYNIE